MKIGKGAGEENLPTIILPNPALTTALCVHLGIVVAVIAYLEKM